MSNIYIRSRPQRRCVNVKEIKILWTFCVSVDWQKHEARLIIFVLNQSKTFSNLCFYFGKQLSKYLPIFWHIMVQIFFYIVQAAYPHKGWRHAGAYPSCLGSWMDTHSRASDSKQTKAFFTTEQSTCCMLLTAGSAKKATPIILKVAASKRPFQVFGTLSP